MTALYARVAEKSAKTIVQGGGQRFPKWSIPEI